MKTRPSKDCARLLSLLRYANLLTPIRGLDPSSREDASSTPAPLFLARYAVSCLDAAFAGIIYLFFLAMVFSAEPFLNHSI